MPIDRRSSWLKHVPEFDITPLCSGDDRGGKKIVDGVREGEVRSETVPKGPFHHQNDGLPLSGSVGHSTHTFSGSEEQSFHPSRVPKRPEWQDRFRIPACMTGLTRVKLCEQVLEHEKGQADL